MSRPDSITDPQHRWLPVFLLFAAGFAGRLLPHPPNFTPLGGIALFGAAVLGRRWLALLLPFAVLYASDLVINNVVYAEYYPTFTWSIHWPVYLGFALVVGLGFWQLRDRKAGPRRLALTAIGGSTLFYLLTNYFSWYYDPTNLYADGPAGLLASYVAALPFFFNSLLGDLFFTGVLFGGYGYYRSVHPATVRS